MLFFRYFFYLVIVYLAFLASLTLFGSKGKPLYLRLLPLFLALTLIVEISGYILIMNTGKNMIVFRFFVPVWFSYHLYVAYSVLSEKWQKKAIAASMVLFMLMTVIDFSFFPSDLFPALVYGCGTFLVLFFYLFYFFGFIDFPITRTPKREPLFWIFLGITVFHAGTLPVLIITNLLIDFSAASLMICGWITWGLNIFLYSCLLVSFFCKGIFREKNISN